MPSQLAGPDCATRPNAAVLIGLLLAISSGKLMDEDWLRSGELEHCLITCIFWRG